MLKPLEIKRISDKGLQITWQNGQVQTLTSEILRRQCPCAGCREARGESLHAEPLTPKKPSLLKVIKHSKDEEISLSEVWAVGNYAVGLRFADGHDTGIYTYEMLHRLGDAAGQSIRDT